MPFHGALPSALHDIYNCPSLKRIKSIIASHDEMVTNEQYKLEYILNDFIHITQDHNDDNTFEILYNLLNVKCDLNKCIGLKRNQRDRSSKNKDDNKNNININDIVRMDIFDQIHCYLLHSFDIGYRLTKKEKQTIQQEFKNDDNNDNTKNSSFNRMRNILNNKRKQLQNSMGFKNRINHSKFVTQNESKYDETKSQQNDNDDDDDDPDISNTIYSFSHAFDYWSEQNENNPLTTTPKYTHLKEEITTNTIYALDIEKFEMVEKKAKFFINCNYSRQLKCFDKVERNGPFSKYKSGAFYQGAPITESLLMVIILYCDYTSLSYNFSTTFRYGDNAKNIKQLTERHGNYYWFGRALRELVEGYSKEIFDGVNDRYYHGISEQMIFQSTIARFNHPTSTTKKLTVAQTFATNKKENKN